MAIKILSCKVEKKIKFIRSKTLKFIDFHKPKIVIIAAARVGGIIANLLQNQNFCTKIYKFKII